MDWDPRGPVVSRVMALTGLGDALLYLVLSLYAGALGSGPPYDTGSAVVLVGATSLFLAAQAAIRVAEGAGDRRLA